MVTSPLDLEDGSFAIHRQPDFRRKIHIEEEY